MKGSQHRGKRQQFMSNFSIIFHPYFFLLYWQIRAPF